MLLCELKEICLMGEGGTLTTKIQSHLMLYLLISRNWNILIDTEMFEYGLLDTKTIAKNKEEYLISHICFKTIFF